MHILKSSIALVLFLSACETYVPMDNVQPLLPVSGPSGKQALTVARIAPPRTIQPRSIAEDREYCGYLGPCPTEISPFLYPSAARLRAARPTTRPPICASSPLSTSTLPMPPL